MTKYSRPDLMLGLCLYTLYFFQKLKTCFSPCFVFSIPVSNKLPTNHLNTSSHIDNSSDVFLFLFYVQNFLLGASIFSPLWTGCY